MDIELLGADAARALLDQYAPRKMQERIEKGTSKAARSMVPVIRREIKRSIKAHGHRPGYLAQRVSVRKARASALTASGSGSLVGSSAQHNHLVIQGHRIVSHAGVDSGKNTTPNPFIDRVDAAAWVIADPILRREVFGE